MTPNHGFLAYFALMSALLLVGPLLGAWRKVQGAWAATGGVLCGGVLFGVWIHQAAFGGDPFAMLAFVALTLFTFLPVSLLLCGFQLRDEGLAVGMGFAGAAILMAMIGLYSSVLEPRWIETTTLTVKTSKVTARFRVVLLADIQCDTPGSYEQDVFARIADAKPDLVLLAGDYLQVPGLAMAHPASGVLRKLMSESGIRAAAYAVRGNVDAADWAGLFTGLGITTVERTTPFAVSSQITLTALSLEDSADVQLEVPQRPGFHIVLGHKPDFALGRVNADLLLAGHTHGGQVQIPLFGPPITFSAIPRAWAEGATRLDAGRTLVVSRGIGMERGYAPRLRFLARPQLVVIDLVP